nr:hypothetical protein [Tanacetum cinerariifolium]
MEGYILIMSVKWHMSLLDLLSHSTRSEEVFGYILLVKIKLLIKKLEDSEDEHQVQRRIIGIKRLLSAIEVTATGYEVIAADIKKDENELELTFPYKEADPFNPPPHASDSKSDDMIEIEDTVEQEDETVLANVHEVGESSTATFLRADDHILLPGFMRTDINSLLGRIANLSRRLCGREMAHALVKKKGKAKNEYYGKLILDLGNEV